MTKPDSAKFPAGDERDARTVDRRDFLKIGGGAAAGLLAQNALGAPAELPALPSNPATPATMPTRNLGRTGYRVGIFSLGGQAKIGRAHV